jgi:hypothetical protein
MSESKRLGPMIVLAAGLAAVTGGSCGSNSNEDTQGFTCQAVCVGPTGEVGGESSRFESGDVDAAAADCANNQSRNADLCAGIGPFAGRCSCE